MTFPLTLADDDLAAIQRMADEPEWTMEPWRVERILAMVLGGARASGFGKRRRRR